MKRTLFPIVCSLFIGNALSMTLNESIYHALNTNPDILAKQAEKEAQEYNVVAAKGGNLPKVNVRGSTGKYYNKAINSPWARATKGQPTTRFRHDMMLSVKQNIFNGYGTIYGIEKEQKQLEHDDYMLKSKKNSEAYQVAAAFFAIRKNERLVDLSRRVIKNYNVLLSNVRKNGSDSDEKLVIAALEESKAMLAGYISSLAVAKVKFESLVGQTGVSLKNPNLKLDCKDFEDLVHSAQQNSPVLMSAVAREQSTKAGYNKSKSSFMPKVDLTLDAARGFHSRFYGTVENMAKVLVVFSSNVFNGGIDRAKMNAHKSKLVAAKYKKQSEFRKLRINLSMAYNNYLKYKLNAESYYKSYAQRRSLIMQYMKQSSSETIDYRSVIEEIQSYTKIRSKLINADELSDLSAVKVLSLLGKLA